MRNVAAANTATDATVVIIAGIDTGGRNDGSGFTFSLGFLFFKLMVVV